MGRELPDLGDGSGPGLVPLLAGLLMFGVDEGDVGQFDKPQNVAEIRFPMIEAFRWLARAECASAR